MAPHFCVPARLPTLLRGSCRPAGAASLAHPTGTTGAVRAGNCLSCIDGQKESGRTAADVMSFLRMSFGELFDPVCKLIEGAVLFIFGEASNVLFGGLEGLPHRSFPVSH